MMYIRCHITFFFGIPCDLFYVSLFDCENLEGIECISRIGPCFSWLCVVWLVYVFLMFMFVFLFCVVSLIFFVIVCVLSCLCFCDFLLVFFLFNVTTIT